MNKRNAFKVRLLKCAPLLLMAYVPWVMAGSVKTLDSILAVVNDEVITRYEFTQQKNVLKAQLERQKVALPSDDIFQKQLLEKMITDRAQLQFAKETGIRIEETQVDRSIARIASENQMSMEQFRSTLLKEGSSLEKFREEIRQEMILARIREREVESRVVVSEAEIDTFMTSNPEGVGQSEEYRLAHIFVRIPEQASPEQVLLRQKRAEEALQQVNSGQDFAKVAAEFSDAPDALQGGDLGWRSVARIPVVMAEAAKKLTVQQVSTVLRSPAGFHLVKLLEKRTKDTPVLVEQTHARHILVKVNELVSESDALAKIQQLQKKLSAGTDFAEVAKLGSEDLSAAKGGDLGWISAGDTVPEFEEAMNRLKPNETSEPIRSPFGWHLIQVLERRKEDISAQRSRAMARNALRERKAEEAYQEWLRQIRDRAYVEIRPDEN